MYRRPAVCSLDPFSPYRADVAPSVVRLVQMISFGHEYGIDQVEIMMEESDSPRMRALLGLAIRHFNIDEGGECIDQNHRRQGKVLRGSLAKRVACRLHLSPVLVHALMNLLPLPVHASVWLLIECDVIDPVLLWKSLIREPRFRQAMMEWAALGVDAEPPRPFVLAVLNDGDLPKGWAAEGEGYWQDRAPSNARSASG